MLPSSQYWVVEAESAEQFRAEMAGADIAIDSSVLVATGNMSSHLHIVDVYRPQPEADIRWWNNLYGAPIQVQLSKEKTKNCDNFREVSLTALISMELQYKLTTMC